MFLFLIPELATFRRILRPATMPMHMCRCSRREAKELRMRPVEDSRPPMITVTLQVKRFPRKLLRGAGNTVRVHLKKKK